MCDVTLGDDFISHVKKGIINIIAIINLVDNENISLDASLAKFDSRGNKM